MLVVCIGTLVGIGHEIVESFYGPRYAANGQIKIHDIRRFLLEHSTDGINGRRLQKIESTTCKLRSRVLSNTRLIKYIENLPAGSDPSPSSWNDRAEEENCTRESRVEITVANLCAPTYEAVAVRCELDEGYSCRPKRVGTTIKLL